MSSLWFRFASLAAFSSRAIFFPSRAKSAAAAIALMVALSAGPSLAQTAPAPQPTPQAVTPAAPSEPSAAPQTNPNDPFGESATLTAKTMIYVKGNGTWDKAFDTITGSFKKIKAYLDKEGLKADGLPMTIFTATDDNGFDYEAAIPIAEAPKNPPHGDILMGQSPDGQALKFIHRGSYEELDNTYEAITNYLDEKRLEAKDMFIEEYVTDPLTADLKKLVVNVYVLIKPPETSPG